MAMRKAPRIHPTEYKKLLDGLEIVAIVVDQFSGEVLDRKALSETMARRLVKVAEKSSMDPQVGDKVDMRYSYILTVCGDDTDKERVLMRLKVTFRITYATANRLPRDFFEVFRNTSLPLQVAPFARAWFHDHCLRMGVPPLIMPLVRTA